MATVQLFATNLHNPSHMAWTSDGKLLVSELSAGRVKDVTSGGDMRDVAPYAWGLQGPAGILPRSGGQILVAEVWSGTVRDIAGGGDVSGRTPFSNGLQAPYSLGEMQKQGMPKIFVSESQDYRKGWLSDITNGGTRQPGNIWLSEIPVIPGRPGVTPLSSWPTTWQQFAVAGCVKNWQEPPTAAGTTHYLSVGALGQVLDLTTFGGGTYMEAIDGGKLVAWGLSWCGGMKLHPSNGLLYVAEPATGDILPVTPGSPKTYQFERPVVRGLSGPNCIRFSSDGLTMYVCGMGDGVIWKITNFQ